MDIRTTQKPLKDRYKADPKSAQLTIRAHASQHGAPVACNVDIGRAVYEAQAHAGVGGAGTAACSGDLLLGALAACAQLTCQMVAANMEIATQRIDVRAEGDLDLRGTLGIDRDVAVGFTQIRVYFDIEAPDVAPDIIESLKRKTERYCVVYQTLMKPGIVSTMWNII